MAFSYDPLKLDSTPLFQVRFRLGDTEASTAMFQDEEILYALKANKEDVIRACVACVSALLPRLAKKQKFTVGPYSEEQGSNSFAYWTKMLDELKAQLASYSSPMMNPPTGGYYFYYGMMGTGVSDAADQSGYF